MGVRERVQVVSVVVERYKKSRRVKSELGRNDHKIGAGRIASDQSHM